MLEINKQLFNNWNDNNLSYCHWKSNEHLIEGLNGDTDLDILLSKDDKESGITTLRSIGFVRFHSQFGSRYPNVDDWIGFDVNTGKLVHLHLHYALMTGHTGMKEYELPWTEETLCTRVQNDETGVYIMNPNLELVSLYTRLILKAKRQWVRSARKGKYKMDKHFFVEIEFIKKQTDWKSVIDIAKRYYGDKGDEFVEIVRSEKLSSKQFLHLYTIVTETMRGCSRYHGISLFVRKRYYSFAVFVRKKLKSRFGLLLITKKTVNPLGGFSVAFIGQDGCGKSTVTTDIQKWLNWKIEAHRFYLGSGEHYNSFQKRIMSFALKFKQKDNKKQLVSEQRTPIANKSQKKNIKNLLRAYLTAHNYLNIARRAYKEVLKSNKYLKQGGIPIFDRFPQNQFEGIYDGPKIVDYCRRTGLDFWVIEKMARKELKYIEKTQLYQPSLVFKLMLSPEESIRRKPFESFEAVSRKHEITKKIEFSQSSVFFVDATQDYDKELLFIKNKIWNVIKENQ